MFGLLQTQIPRFASYYTDCFTEVSPNNRAGCIDGVCKKEGVKLMKGELRFGVWVEIQGHGGWKWRHW